MKKRLTALTLAAAMVMGTIALAAGTEKTITVTPMQMTINGQAVTPQKSDGIPAEVFAYDGATYVPLRYLSELLGVQVDWSAEEAGVAKLEGENLKVPAAGGLQDGTYTGTSAGFGGAVVVTITVSGGKVTDCTVTGDKETAGIGGKAVAEMPQQIKNAQSAEVDGISGATITSTAVKSAAQSCVDQALGIKKDTQIHFQAGTYEGTGSGMMGPITVSVTLSDTKIENVEVTGCNDTLMIGQGLDTAPVKVIPTAIVASQTLNVDAVTGATVTSAGVLGAVKDALGKAGADTTLLQMAPVVPAGKDESYTCDVVVAGAGGAGLFAALEAAHNGAKVIVVEKAGVLTGNSTRNGGLLMASGTAYTSLTNDQLYDYIVNYIGRGDVDTVKIRNFVDNSNDMLEYFRSIGTEIDCVSNIWDDVVELPAVYMANGENADGEIELRPGFNTSVGMYYMAPLYEQVIDQGATVLFHTPMTEILTDESGRAVGIVCERADGSTVTINASAVIIATGGYGGSKEKLKENVTMSDGDFNTYAASTDTGDGIWLAEGIGAKIRYETDLTTMSPTANSIIGNISRSLMITPAGQRFTREFDYFFSVEADLNREGYSVCYELIDDSFEDEFWAGVIAAAESGSARDVFVADSLEELSATLGIDAKTLRATVERYNSLCAAGKDTDYEKDPRYMQAISTDGSHRVIAIKRVPTVCDTYGGIYTDADTRVLDQNDNVIPGLYAAGAAALTGWVNYEYPGCGYGFGVSLYTGRVAGLSALADLGFSSVKDIVKK